MIEDYYKVLGLKRGATSKEISAAYRSQALIYHPDKRKSSSTTTTNSAEDHDEKFQKVKAAYQALQDPKIRAELDLKLIGQEERIKRDEKMSAQRKKMRDDLFNREKEALNPVKKRSSSTEDNPKKKEKLILANEDACLILKCKFPSNLDPKLKSEMIKSLLNENHLTALHFESESTLVAEFMDSKSAHQALCQLPNDLIVKADWYSGYPPENLTFYSSSDVSEASVNKLKPEPVKSEVKYSRDFENSILEKLKQRKNKK